MISAPDERYTDPASYEPRSDAWRAELVARTQALAELGAQWANDPVINEKEGKIPRPVPGLRVTPKE